MTHAYRCIVTGHNATGRSVVVADSAISVGVLGMADFWRSATVPASLTGDPGIATGPPRLEPSPGGVCFRFFEIPLADTAASLQPGAAAAEFAAAGAVHCQVDTARHPMMHTTATVDCVVLLRGRVTLLLDEGEMDLQPFDAVVQRGTNHYWINRGTEPALLAAVLVDAR